MVDQPILQQDKLLAKYNHSEQIFAFVDICSDYVI